MKRGTNGVSSLIVVGVDSSEGAQAALWPRRTPSRFGGAREGTVTLVYGARDSEHNDAVVLAEILCREFERSGRGKGS
jgi:hypothetical protein